MKVEKIICDRCGKEGALNIEVKVGREIDPSGNGYAYDFDSIDLCHRCCSSAIKNMMDLAQDYNKSKLILSDLRKARPAL